MFASDSLKKLASVATTLPGGVGAAIVQTLFTPDLDLTIAQDIVLPSLPGYVTRNPLAMQYMFSATAGVVTTWPTLKMGNNATFDNLAGSQTPAQATAFATGAPVQGSTSLTGVAGGTVKVVDLATPITVSITAGATGVGLTLRGRLLVLIALVPV